MHRLGGSVVDGGARLCSETASAALVSARDFVELVGASFILLLSVFPNTVSLVCDLVIFAASQMSHGLEFCQLKIADVHQTALETPIEFSIGLFTCESILKF